MSSGIRFAIRMAPDVYSNGPQVRMVPLNKAKLWTNIGHVKTHLQGVGHVYPKGATVVEVEVLYREKDIDSVANLIDASEKKAAARREEQDRIYAKDELNAAKRRLKDAEQNARRKGIL